MLGYEKRNGEKTGAVFTPEALEAGAVEITEHLWGKYRDCNGKLKNVNGDIAKVEYASVTSFRTTPFHGLLLILKERRLKQ